MKHQLILSLAALLTAFAAQGAPTVKDTSPTILAPSPDHYRATKLISRFLDRYHYKDFSLNDEFSNQIFLSYIESLDPNKIYFVQSDVTNFNAYQYKLDDAIKSLKLDIPYQIFNVYQQRVKERVQYANSLLSTNFDFTQNEQFLVDRSKANWATGSVELNEIWRKRVKNDMLTLRLTNEPAQQIKETLTKRYNSILKSIQQTDSEDVYQLFMNAYVSSIEPHTNYLSPRSSENFEIRMSLSLEGIGALLRTDGEFTVVDRVIPGGPADLSNLLHATDRIIGIKQQKDKEFEDVVGWRLEDVVELIRGPKDTIVYLQILPGSKGQNATREEISITRDKINLEEQAAKKSVIEITDNNFKQKVGVIEIPTFYLDFAAYQRGDENFRSTTRDVKKLISELNQQHVDALIVDLRSNGGGSLTEATQLAGLFLERGPIVQVRDSAGNIEVHQDKDPAIAYTGPLIILVDRFSASASEIVASAIQDYRRGIIVGETTFGKGTVQQLVDLNNFDESSDDSLGQLKATIAQYFRINGSGTQYRGVIPDLPFNTIYDEDSQGERSYKNALPWSSIAPLQYDIWPVDRQIISEMNAKHINRVTRDEKFKSLFEVLKLDQQIRSENSVSLVEVMRKKEYEKIDKLRVKHEKTLNQYFGTDGEENEEDQLDILLDETAHIAGDLANALQQRSASSFAEKKN